MGVNCNAFDLHLQYVLLQYYVPYFCEKLVIICDHQGFIPFWSYYASRRPHYTNLLLTKKW